MIPTPTAPEEIDRFLAGKSFPLIEPGTATFVYRGDAASVSLRPMIAGFPGPHIFRRLEGTDLWWLSLPLPDGARLEYKLEVLRDHRAEWINDPLNPLTTTNPFGTNSVCRANGYQVPEWARPRDGTATGSFADLWVDSRLGGSRKVAVYRPAGFDPLQTYPLVMVHDGGDYLRYGSMALVLDNLISMGLVPPLLAAFSWPGDRLHEYAADPAHARFVVEEALPRLAASYSIGPDRVAMGASLGAVAALHAAWTYPAAFSALLLQSGTFAQTPGWEAAGHILGPISKLLHRLQPSQLPGRVFLSCGTYERMIGENRMMARRLDRAGIAVRYVESRDGHTWEAWRDRLADGLTWVLQPPV
jgi:enterochelin esterase family protein